MNTAILMGILLKLLTKQTTAKQLAETFEVSTRSIYRYVEILCQSGVPIISLQGKNGGLFVNPNYHIQNLFLTANELNELISVCKSPTLKQKLEFVKHSQTKMELEKIFQK